MGPLIPEPEEEHFLRGDRSCDALTRLAPHAMDAVHEFVQHSLPLLPAEGALASLTHVLDLGCGQHLWGRELFRTMLEEAGPELVADVCIEGIECCPEVVQTARQAIRTGRRQVIITQGDLLHLPPASQERLSLVQLRFLAPSLSPGDWPQALAQARRACAPGGTVVWLEPLLPTFCVQAPGWNQWLLWIAQAMAAHGSSPSISQSMDRLFAQVGPWERRHSETIHLPLVRAVEGQGFLLGQFFQAAQSWMRDLRPWLVEGGIPAAEVQQGVDRVLAEINHREIESTWPWIRIVGTRPHEQRTTMEKRSNHVQ